MSSTGLTKGQQFWAEMCEGYERNYGGQMIPALAARFRSMAAMMDTCVVCGRCGVQTEPVYVHGGGTFGACADPKLHRRSDVYPVCADCVNASAHSFTQAKPKGASSVARKSPVVKKHLIRDKLSVRREKAADQKRRETDEAISELLKEGPLVLPRSSLSSVAQG